MTINSMIDYTARCVKCGATKRDGCDCWVKLKCTSCGRTRMTVRDKTDPPETAEVHCTCNECGDGMEVSYFNKHGEQILEF